MKVGQPAATHDHGARRTCRRANRRPFSSGGHPAPCRGEKSECRARPSRISNSRP